jgi:hypothetical protein
VGAAADYAAFPVSLDGLPAVHLRVLLDGLPVFERYGLLLAGGYAFTRDDTPLPDIAEHVRHAFQAAGYSVRLVEATSGYARLVLRLPGPGEELEMDLLKEALEPGWVTVQITPAACVRAVLPGQASRALAMCAEVGGRVLMVPLAPARSSDPRRCRPIGCYEASQALTAQYRKVRR